MQQIPHTHDYLLALECDFLTVALIPCSEIVNVMLSISIEIESPLANL